MVGLIFALGLGAYQLGLYGWCLLHQNQGPTMGFADLALPSHRAAAQAWWSSNVAGKGAVAGPGSATGGAGSSAAAPPGTRPGGGTKAGAV